MIVLIARSYYTYNGITALQILPGLTWALTATDGGKLEVFNLQSGTCLLSQTVHPTAITALSSSSQLKLVTADRQATVKIFRLQVEGETCSLSCVFQSEDLTFSLNQRPILGVTMPGKSYHMMGQNCGVRSFLYIEDILLYYIYYLSDGLLINIFISYNLDFKRPILVNVCLYWKSRVTVYK